MLFIAYRLPAWDDDPVGATSKFDVRHNSELRMKKNSSCIPLHQNVSSYMPISCLKSTQDRGSPSTILRKSKDLVSPPLEATILGDLRFLT